MSSCPICNKHIANFGAGSYDCPDCHRDFERQNFLFAVPENLNLAHFEYGDYADMGDLFFQLSAALLSPEQYNAEIQKIVKKVNARGNPTPTQLAAEAERKRASDYAQSLLRH